MNIKKILLYWIPPVCWMMAIFLLSARQRVAFSETYTINFIIFKSFHVIEYAVLFFLLFRALYGTKKMPVSKMFLYAMLIAILYGASDEFHQTFVPTREGQLKDVVIDSIGILLMFSYTKNNLPKLKRFL